MEHMQKVPELRVTVNSRCQRACFFCRPSGEAVNTSSGKELDTETVLQVAKICSRYGVSYIKLTGGDPALWDPLIDCVLRLRNETKYYIEVISRHPQIANKAVQLAASGIDTLNVSIDTLDPELHRKITGVNDLPQILEAIRTCINSGLRCKVNMVVLRGINEHEIENLIAYCEAAGVKVLKLLDLMTDIEDGGETFVQRMKLLGFDSLRALYAPLEGIAVNLRKRASREKRFRQRGGLGNPMLALTMQSGLEIIVKDHHFGAWYGSICRDCKHYPCSSALMALRLTADSRLQFCLFREDLCIDIKNMGAGELANTIDHALNIYREATFNRGPQ